MRSRTPRSIYAILWAYYTAPMPQISHLAIHHPLPPFPYTLPTPNHTTIHSPCFFPSIHFYHVLRFMRERMILHTMSPCTPIRVPRQSNTCLPVIYNYCPHYHHHQKLQILMHSDLLAQSHKGRVLEPTADVAVIPDTLYMRHSRNVIQTIEQSRKLQLVVCVCPL